ncbi:hypothetical protein ACP26L_06575 [Paenibacillus sp. S-38]
MIQGMGDNEFAPSSHADRAQGVTILLRALQSLNIIE